MKTKIIVSACLLGENCKYSGGNNKDEKVIALSQDFELIPVCPECFGGLPIPRTASEIDMHQGGQRVLSAEGEDRTAAFQAGAQRCVEIAREEGCTLAVMKAKSPSCGSGQVYDGTFSGTLVPGDGIATRYLTLAGVRVISENDVESLLVLGKSC